VEEEEEEGLEHIDLTTAEGEAEAEEEEEAGHWLGDFLASSRATGGLSFFGEDMDDGEEAETFPMSPPRERLHQNASVLSPPPALIPRVPEGLLPDLFAAMAAVQGTNLSQLASPLRRTCASCQEGGVADDFVVCPMCEVLLLPHLCICPTHKAQRPKHTHTHTHTHTPHTAHIHTTLHTHEAHTRSTLSTHTRAPNTQGGVLLGVSS
jgi:hypothetical protein